MSGTPRSRTPSTTSAAAIPRVTFKLDRPGARAAFVAGTFNGWQPSATPLKASEPGAWAAELELPPGVYEYRFVVDGEWFPDPHAAESAPNPFGGTNSVVRVKPVA